MRCTLPGAWSLLPAAIRLIQLQQVQLQPASLFRKGITKTSDSVSATEIHLLKQKKAIAVQFSDGSKFTFPAELLRVESPSAANLRTKQGEAKVVHGRRYVGILGVEPVGNYAIRVVFDDLHSSGLFSWDFLRELGLNKRARIRSYIQRLRAQGLSREPPGVRRPRVT